MKARLSVALVLIFVVACLPPAPNISPLASPLPAPSPDLVLPLSTNYSKLSVVIGNQPTGLGEFLEDARPTVVCSINNGAYGAIIHNSPNTLFLRRIQNDVWSRLPDGMYAGLGTPHALDDARASADYEALGKTIFVPYLGRLNYMQYVQLAYQDYLKPMNEPVLGGPGGDDIAKAEWLNAWFVEWLTIAHSYGLHGAIFGFPTGEPPLEAVPYLVEAARLAAQNGDVIAVHEYGIEGPLMGSPSSGALRYRQFHDALPADARPRFVVTEFSSGNGYGTGLNGTPWINDAILYGLQLKLDLYVMGACAFQVDDGAESTIPADVLSNYTHAAARVDWGSTIRAMYLPMVGK